jgi:tight adherence protein B
MTEPWIVPLFVFLSAALLVGFAYRYYSQDFAAKRKINRRLSLIEETGDQKQALTILRRERGIGDIWPWLEGLHTTFVQSGLRFEGAQFLLVISGLTGVSTTAITLLLGFNPLNIALGFVISSALVYIFVRTIRARRIARFTEQLPDVLDVIVRSLRAGHPMPTSLALVAREMPDPAGTEFGIASDEVTYGLALPAAMQNLAVRVGDPEFNFVVMAASVQAQTGGNMAEVLSRLSKLIRDRFKLRRKVHALSAEGRFSAIALSVIPFILFVIINLIYPKYFGDVWDNSIFRMAMALAGFLLVTGNIVMWRMVNFKY